jgi:hypothetical protein
MKKNKQRVIYIEFPDEGHGFRVPENNNVFCALMEKFLADHLGGRFEPMTEDEKKILDNKATFIQ